MTTPTQEMPRELLLLRAAYQLLKQQTESPYVLDLLATTAVWDGVECDGYCLMEEARDLLQEKGYDPDATDEGEYDD